MLDWTYRLRLRHLQMLLSIAQTGNLSQSAEALHTTQPALSKWLKELEADVGLPLFERHARGLRPTPYGEAMVQHARSIIGHLDSARDDMDALRDGGSGLITVGTSGVSAADTVPLAVARLIRQMPRAQVRLAEGTMNRLIPQLLQGEIDIVVGRAANPQLTSQLKTETLYHDPVNFVSGLEHPLVSRDAVGWGDLFSYRWIVWPEGTPIRNALESALISAGRSMPRNCIESNSSLLNITLLKHSELLGVASQRAAQRFERLSLLHVLPMPFGGAGAVSMYWRADAEGRHAVALALDCLRASAEA
ncbi:LysR substrate-binding domain-containing protein [Paraburkholderia lycopersici]|uniref:DNA-binding transcriptional regulator, LysR family n=1 Tax=Paraburkholderia lycopersici TaxID=416944 RepID=A0A1G6R0F1_9BURK|nr:LysR substrate-binding domain-containing protein [Paraburkholderia lycopersici]SDC97386.1 DNA-binding transcriptional regulator, LysR family [Paraburkholderia lycopersici]